MYFALHLLLPVRLRVWLIIAGSAYFYGSWKIEYLWIPFFLMGVAYIGAICISSRNDKSSKQLILVSTLCILFLPLLVYKYLNFFHSALTALTGAPTDKLVDLALPLGISFITFTLTAYVVDIYTGRYPCPEKPKSVLAYVLFFPHLIAGPILRPSELLPQITHQRKTSFRKLKTGLAIFTLGLVKKMIFADQIAEFVDRVYATGHPSGTEALLSIYGFSVQIYCDFSGYTDMAIGVALLLGVGLPTNFHRPYTARTLVDFWRRWHVTLSTWLRDYLYIPLGGNRCGPYRKMGNLMVTMLLGGLWHGANWTFVAWGALHGLGLCVVNIFSTLSRRFSLPPLPGVLSVLLTFNFISLCWVYFRAPSIEVANTILLASVSGNWGEPVLVLTSNLFLLFLLIVFFALHKFDNLLHIR
ncbi:MAG TPA: MBOAT family O-acyltransferase, partial [Humidesulfovibrio sp.]|nr:MBOAT family O-acyltransferase [Humidesulfovibrio sp.]